MEHVVDPGPSPELRVGCAMWADRRWVGRYLPGDTPAGWELSAYATWCTAVEGNTTFYALPEPAAVARWAEQAPARFRFCFKLPRTITHDRRLRDAHDDLAAFVHRTAPLAERMGPTSIQLPASFAPTDLPALDRFLASVPSERRWGVEVRHRAFEAGGAAEERLHDLLARRRAERVVIDTRAVFAGPRRTPAEIEAWERKPRLRVRPVALGVSPVVRFIGQSDPDANPPFWQPWVDVVVRWLQEGRRPIVFVHTPDNLDAPALARRFHAEVAEAMRVAGAAIAALPDPRRDPRQPSLFDR